MPPNETGEQTAAPAASPAVFISHRRGSDGPRQLRAALAGLGISAFLDEEEIAPGDPFPERLARAMLDARVVVAFLDGAYLEKPWCVYELRVATAPYRSDTNASLEHLVVALPATGDLAGVTDRLPPPVAGVNWPVASATADLAVLIREHLERCPKPVRERLSNLDDDAVKCLRNGALVPAPTIPPSGATLLGGMPASLKERFVGRADLLWLVHEALDARGKGNAPRSCAIEGGGGMGKTQLAAEYVSRYGRQHYPGGCLWIDAGGGDEHLARQLHAVLQCFDPQARALETFGERPSDQVTALQTALGKRVPTDPSTARILWVVDDVPEPGVSGNPPQPLERWCPVRDRVALLCTSRRSGIKDAESHVPVRELGVGAAVELLTQPPVGKNWIGAGDWKHIARWLGCWPVGLRIAQASLADGYLTAEGLLKSARGDEPARALDDEVEVLREDVVADYVHGVAEIFRGSYDALVPHPAALRGAHLLARLARVPLPQAAIETLVPARERGLLAKRSWIEPQTGTGNGKHRLWGMQRVIASYLRGISNVETPVREGLGPDAELVRLCDWLESMFVTPSPIPGAELGRHLRVLADGIVSRLEAQPADELRAAAARLALTAATWRLDDFDQRAPRFHAARLAAAVGADAELTDRLRAGLASGDEGVARSAIAAAGGMCRSEHAAHFLIEAVDDPREPVRWQVPPTASLFERADVLAIPLITKLMQRAGEWNANLAIQLDPLLESDAVLPALVPMLLERLGQGGAPQQRLAAEFLGSILRLRGSRLASDLVQATCQGLFNRALHAQDKGVAAAASEALAVTGDLVLDPLRDLLKSREQVGDALWCRAVDVFVAILVTRERPQAPAYEWIVDDGESTFVVRGWPKAQRKPELFAPLAEIAVTPGEAGVRDFACRALLGEVFGQALPGSIMHTYLVRGGHDCWLMRSVVDARPALSGRLALGNAVNDAIANGHGGNILPIAALAIRFDPEFASPYWWRGQVREQVQEFAAAREDYTRVVALTPRFAAAWAARGYCERALGENDAALADFERAIELEPGEGEWRLGRAAIRHALDDEAGALEDVERALQAYPEWAAAHELKAGVQGALGQWPQCIESASRALELGAGAMPSLYYRAVAEANLGQSDAARADVDQALAHSPADARLAALREQLTAQR